MLGALVLFLVLTIPGSLVVRLFSIREFRSINSLLFSYAIFILLLTIASVFQTLIVLYFAYSLILLIFLVTVARYTLQNRTVLTLKSTQIYEVGCNITIVSSTIIYLYIVGPYLELPADVWQHLTSIRDYSKSLEKGYINLNQPWYSLYAFCLVMTDTHVKETVVPVTVIFSCAFTFFLAVLARHMFRHISPTTWHIEFGVCLGVFLTILLFGTSVFSFFRYYVFAPVFLCYPIFLYLSIVLVEGTAKVNSPKQLLVSLVIVLTGIFVTYLVHKQETLFLASVCVTIGTVYLARLFLGSLKINFNHALKYEPTKIVFILFLIFFIVVVVYQFSQLPLISTPLANNTILLPFSVGFGPTNLFVSDPGGRYYETVGFVGIAISLIYLTLVRPKQRTLTILTISPYLIVFNPIAATTFVSLASHDTLWRFSYIVPTGLLSAYVVLHYLTKLSRSITICAIIILLSASYLLPKLFENNLLQSRASTLQRVDKKNTIATWSDLISFLGRYERNILTDPITGYMLNAYTNNKVFGFKFHGTGDFIPINYEQYSMSHFDGFHQWLIVINQRDGAFSRNGHLSGHWDKDLLKLSEYYSDKLIDFLETSPPHIRLIWSQNNTLVYEIE